MRTHGKVLSLTWNNVDLTRRTIKVENHIAKDGQTRTIPLNLVAFASLRNLNMRVPGPWESVANKVGKRRGDKHWEQNCGFRTVFDSACRHAKLSGVTPIVLRHTHASQLIVSRVDLRTVQEIGNWKSLGIVERHARLRQDPKRQALELLAVNATPRLARPAEKCGSEDDSKPLQDYLMGR